MPLYSPEHRQLMEFYHPQKHEEYSDVLSALGGFMERKLLPASAKFDTGEAKMAPVRKELLGHGICQIAAPAEYGGLGLPFSLYANAIEMLGTADASTALSIEIHNAVIEGLLKYGSEGQRQARVPGLAAGERLASFCLTEPTSGSDSRNMATVAVTKGKGYAITGSKMFITNAGEANTYMVFARSGKGPTCLLVDAPNAGMEFGGDLKKLGMRGSRTSEITFRDCQTPAENLVGEEGKGADYAHGILHGARIVVAALNVGIARLAYEKSVQYAKQRRAFGQEISDFQLTREKIADMKTSITAARLLYFHAALLRERGLDFASEASQAKVFATEMSLKVCDDAIQIHGGYGYTTDELHRHWRDARLLTIGEGTSEVLRMLIASRELAKTL